MAKPPIVSTAEWERARTDLLTAEKAATRALDALAARRRRLPMVKFGDYVFSTPAGPQTLADLFGDREQLVTYQFMDLGPDRFCPGCTGFTNNIPSLDGLAECGVSWDTNRSPRCGTPMGAVNSAASRSTPRPRSKPRRPWAFWSSVCRMGC